MLAFATTTQCTTIKLLIWGKFCTLESYVNKTEVLRCEILLQKQESKNPHKTVVKEKTVTLQKIEAK